MLCESIETVIFYGGADFLHQFIPEFWVDGRENATLARVPNSESRFLMMNAELPPIELRFNAIIDVVSVVFYTCGSEVKDYTDVPLVSSELITEYLMSILCKPATDLPVPAAMCQSNPMEWMRYVTDMSLFYEKQR